MDSAPSILLSEGIVVPCPIALFKMLHPATNLIPAPSRLSFPSPGMTSAQRQRRT